MREWCEDCVHFRGQFLCEFGNDCSADWCDEYEEETDDEYDELDD